MNSRFFSGICLAAMMCAGLAAAASDPVPRFAVDRSCHEAQEISADGLPRSTDPAGTGQPDTYHACMQDEQQAHDELVQKWSHFTPPSRRTCISQGAAPSPSYVELLTCLEMNNDDSLPYKADGTLDPSTTMSGRRLGSPMARPAGSPSTGGRRL